MFPPAWIVTPSATTLLELYEYQVNPRRGNTVTSDPSSGGGVMLCLSWMLHAVEPDGPVDVGLLVFMKLAALEGSLLLAFQNITLAPAVPPG